VGERESQVEEPVLTVRSLTSWGGWKFPKLALKSDLLIYDCLPNSPAFSLIVSWLAK
jgi:hypothetical protein